MQTTFNIDYKGKQVAVEQVSIDENNHTYRVMLDDGERTIQQTQDSDGANRWLVDGKEQETSETKEIGAAIEKYMSE